jgi:hypothetical protein
VKRFTTKWGKVPVVVSFVEVGLGDYFRDIVERQTAEAVDKLNATHPAAFDVLPAGAKFYIKVSFSTALGYRITVEEVGINDYPYAKKILPVVSVHLSQFRYTKFNLDDLNNVNPLPEAFLQLLARLPKEYPRWFEERKRRRKGPKWWKTAPRT